MILVHCVGEGCQGVKGGFGDSSGALRGCNEGVLDLVGDDSGAVFVRGKTEAKLN